MWVPCLFLWSFSSLEVYYIVHSKSKSIPWSLLNGSKLFITTLLIILSIIDFSIAVHYLNDKNSNIYNVDIYTPVIKILTFVSIFDYFILHNIKELDISYIINFS